MQHQAHRYRALLNEGTDSAIVAGWIREVEADRLAFQARLRTTTRRTAMTTDEITAIVAALGDMIDVLARAEPADKINIYTRLGLRMTAQTANLRPRRLRTPAPPHPAQLKQPPVT